MKRIITAGLATMAIATTAMADITVKVDPSIAQKEFDLEYGYIADMVKPRTERPEAIRAKGTMTDGKFVIKTLPDGPAQYVIPTGDREYIVIYTKPGEDLSVDLKALSPLSYSITGSRLMEDIAKLDMESSRLLQEYRSLMSNGQPDPAEIEKISDTYDKMFTDYITANPTAEAVPYAVMHLEGQKFLDAYNAMTPEAKASSIALFLEPQKEYVERSIEAERRKVQLQSGDIEAPDFTFENMEGKPVSLKDFRGKWVIIDFWGSWCPWCIKGFPKLKEAYAKYKPQLEIIGVACNDPKDKWEAAVKKYELPWINLYNPEQGGGRLLEDYAVEGFPTKAIVNPEGKIVNITTGENPAFFEVLEKLMK